MKYIFRIVVGVLMAVYTMSCTRNDKIGEDAGGACIYRMKFDCCLEGTRYSATKAGYIWKDGTKVCVQFTSEGSRIKGVATYNGETDDWIVETDTMLSLVTDAHCEVYWFDGLTDFSDDSLIIGPNISSFNDIEAKYTLFEGGLLVVSARLTPMTSRLRFVGEPGRTFRIGGLSYCSKYSIISNTITRESEMLTVTIDEDGSSDYFYVVFAKSNERKLNVEGDNQTAFVRSFSGDVLEIGASGFITVPTITNLGKWTLVNSETSQEIHLPQVSETVVSNVKGTAASVTARVIDGGNGMLLSAGFVYGKNAGSTLETALNCSCEPSEMSDVRLLRLEKLTTYYVRAYVSNPLGLIYGEETSFTTTDEDDKIDVGDFDDDVDLNPGAGTGEEDDVIKDDWSGDEDWGVGDSSGEADDVIKDDWSGDEDWGVGDSSGDADDLVKDDWSGDEDWGVGDNSGDADDLVKESWPEDEDWNDEE